MLLSDVCIGYTSAGIRTSAQVGYRSHKRYYYCNLSTGLTQWEYPELLEEVMEAEETPQPQEIPKSFEVPAIEDIAGGELAMEICNTPPHSPSPPPTPPSLSPPPPPPRLETPPPPPPPMISESRELSPPPPPRISPFPPSKNDSRRQRGKNKKKRPPPASKQQSGSQQSRRSSPTPPPPDLNPPLPPLPPPPSSPPPPPPSDMPPLPPSPPRQQLAYGEPLPPGVDPGEIPYMAHPAQQLVYQPTDLSGQPNAEMESYQHAMQQAYVMAPYQPAMVQPGIASVQGGPVIDYSGMPYMMHTHMTMPAVIAKPPAKKHKAALHAALDSFYSDLATMEPTPTPEGVCEAAAVPAPVLATAEDVLATSEPSIEPDVLLKQADSIAKKKKVKKVVGLGLKKKGVSSLVAKWQQVQQEVRRDFETLDQDNDSCQ